MSSSSLIFKTAVYIVKLLLLLLINLVHCIYNRLWMWHCLFRMYVCMYVCRTLTVLLLNIDIALLISWSMYAVQLSQINAVHCIRLLSSALLLFYKWHAHYTHDIIRSKTHEITFSICFIRLIKRVLSRAIVCQGPRRAAFESASSYSRMTVGISLNFTLVDLPSAIVFEWMMSCV